MDLAVVEDLAVQAERDLAAAEEAEAVGQVFTIWGILVLK